MNKELLILGALIALGLVVGIGLGLVGSAINERRHALAVQACAARGAVLVDKVCIDRRVLR